MFSPPVNPIAPSTISSLRWLRRFSTGIRHGRCVCRNRAAGTPARRNARQAGAPRYPPPIPSISTRTATPRACAAASAATNRRPLASPRKM
jgi:hypothetical protein